MPIDILEKVQSQPKDILADFQPKDILGDFKQSQPSQPEKTGFEGYEGEQYSSSPQTTKEFLDVIKTVVGMVPSMGVGAIPGLMSIASLAKPEPSLEKMGKTIAEYQEKIKPVQEWLAPKTKAGETFAEVMSYPFEKAHELAENARDYWESKGHYKAAFVNQMLLEAAPYLIPYTPRLLKEAKLRGTSPIKIVEEIKQNPELVKDFAKTKTIPTETAAPEMTTAELQPTPLAKLKQMKQEYETIYKENPPENIEQRVSRNVSKRNLDDLIKVAEEREGVKPAETQPTEAQPTETTSNEFFATEPYKESLVGETGAVTIGNKTPDIDIQTVKNVDLNPLEQGLTTLHVADRHPFMKKAIESTITAVQNTNHFIKQRTEQLTNIFNEAEGKPLFGLIRRKSSNLRDIDLMVEGKIPVPQHLTKFVKDISNFLEEQRQRVIGKHKQDIMSNGTPLQQAYLKYLQEGGEKPKYVQPGTINAVEEIQRAMKEAENWGKENYFPRSMQGNYYYLDGNGKILSIGKTPKQAKFNLQERLETNPELKGNKVYFVNGLKSMLNTRHTLNPELRGVLDQAGTSLTRKQFFNLLNKLEEIVDTEIKNADVGKVSGVKVDLTGVAKIQSKTKFAGNLLKRHTEMRGQEADPFKTLTAYTSAVERHLGLSDVKKTLIDFEETLPSHMENAKTYIRKLRENSLGHYDWSNKFVDQVIGQKVGAKPFLLTRAMQKGQSLTANLKLGFAPVKALLNIVDGTLSTLTKTGVKHWANGIKILHTKEGKALVQEVGHLAGMEESFAYSHKAGVQPAVDIIKPMGLYQAAETKVNRPQALAAGYSKGLELFNGDKVKATQYAVDLARLTQGLYDIAAKPVAVRGPVVNTAYQFKQFINNKIRFLSSLSPQQMAFYIPSIVSLYGTRGLWLTMKSIIGITLISDVLGGIGEKANEEMNKKNPELHRGILGLTGYDVSAPGTVQLPTEIKDWLGPLYNDSFKSGEMIIKGLKNQGWTDEDIAQYIAQVAPVGYNIYKGLQLLQSGEIKQGEKLVYRGEPNEGVYNLLGAKTVKQSKESDTIWYESQMKKKQLERMSVISDQILSSKTDTEFEKNIKKAVEVKGILTGREYHNFISGLRKQWKANKLTSRERSFKGLPKNLRREATEGERGE